MARTRKPGRRHRRNGPRLHFEVLESRRILAAQYGFAVNLYEDAGGVPGALIADDTLQAGEEFFLEITAEDLRAEPQGLAAMAVDVIWDPQVLRERDEPFDPTSRETQLVTAAFPLARRGELDNEVGWIHKLRGSAFLSTDAGRAIGADGPERFALLRFQAIAPADDSAIRVRSSGGVGFIPWRPYTQDDLWFELQTITVVPKWQGNQDAPPAVLSAGGENESLAAVPDALFSGWQNAETPPDVDGENGIGPIDALIAINYINAHPGDPSLPDVQAAPPPFYDVNGDQLCTSHDVLLVINALETGMDLAAEGEAPGLPDGAVAAAENDAPPPTAAAAAQAVGAAMPDLAAADPDAGPGAAARRGNLLSGAPTEFRVGGDGARFVPVERAQTASQRPESCPATAVILEPGREQRRQAVRGVHRADRCAARHSSSPAGLLAVLDIEEVLDTLAAAQARSQDSRTRAWDRA